MMAAQKVPEGFEDSSRCVLLWFTSVHMIYLPGKDWKIQFLNPLVTHYPWIIDKLECELLSLYQGKLPSETVVFTHYVFYLNKKMRLGKRNFIK